MESKIRDALEYEDGSWFDGPRGPSLVELRDEGKDFVRVVVKVALAPSKHSEISLLVPRKGKPMKGHDSPASAAKRVSAYIEKGEVIPR